jgi:hypothetical protein
MFRTFIVMLILSALPLPALRAGEFDATARARALAPFIDEQTVGVIHVDLTRIDVDALVSWAVEVGRLEKGAIEDFQREGRSWLADLTKVGGKELYVVLSLADLPIDQPLIIMPLADDLDAQAVRAVLGRIPLFKPISFEKWGAALVGGGANTRKRLGDGKPAARPELTKAFAAAGDTTLQVLLLPPPDARRVIQELLPALPPQLGGGSTRPLTQGLLWAAAGVDLPPRPSLRLTFQSPDANAAQALNDLLSRLLKAVTQQGEVRDFLPEIQHLAEVFALRVEGDRLTLVGSDKRELITFLPPLVSRIYQETQQRAMMNKLKQLALAMINYADAKKGRLPTVANFDKQGKPLLSWRVHLLPFLEQQQLYWQFHLDEPWDSPHNKQLLARMPAVYQGPNRKLNAEGKTIFLLPVGKGAAFKDGPEGLIFPKDFPDGTSNTIFLVEADDAHAVPWTKPADLKIDPEHPERGLGGHFREGFLVALADGSARRIAKTVSKTTLRAAFTPAGGEVLGPDWQDKP